MHSILSSDAEVTVESFPYRHVIINQMFPEAIASQLYEFHQRIVHKADHVGKLEEIGEALYSARNYTPDLVDISSSAISILFSEQLRQFISNLLGVVTNDCIMLHCHRHDPPSKNGIPHNDFGIVCYPHDGPKFNGTNVYQPDTGCLYPDDSRDRQPNARKVARSLACLYYVGNQDWQPGDGGETAMYSTDEKTILKVVPPHHNSLFAFDTSPVSYHAYLASPKKVRDSFIWWYHDEVPRAMARHQSKFEQFNAMGRDPWGRWTPPEVPKYEPPNQT